MSQCVLSKMEEAPKEKAAAHKIPKAQQSRGALALGWGT